MSVDISRILATAPVECGICASKLQHLHDVSEDGGDICFTLCPNCAAKEWIVWLPKETKS